MLTIDILTIFPNVFASPLSESIVKRAQDKDLVKINIHNLRDWSTDNYKSVDDRPFGGGPGMIMRVDIIDRAVTELKLQAENCKLNLKLFSLIPKAHSIPKPKPSNFQKKSI